MGRRMSPSLYVWSMVSLVERDGPDCQICGEPEHPEKPGGAMTIDHIDGDGEHHTLSNMRRAHRSCNTAEANRNRVNGARSAGRDVAAERASVAAETLAGNGHQMTNGHDSGLPDHLMRLYGEWLNEPKVQVSEREKETGRTGEVREVVDYSKGSPEMQASDLFEVPYLRWLYDQIKRKGKLTKQDAINAGARHVGASTSTTRRYLDKETSSEGGLEVVKDEDRQNIVRLREQES